MADRAKILARFQKILARVRSPNGHESRLAQTFADEFRQQNGITDAEVAALLIEKKQDAKHYAGSYAADWRIHLALAIGQKHGCKPFQAKGRLFFDGTDASNASAQFRAIVDELGHTCEYTWRSHDDDRTWSAMFRGAIVDGSPEPCYDAWWLERITRLVWRAANETISMRPGFVLVSANQPGDYATLFCAGQRCHAEGHLCSFDDVKRTYTWVFKHRKPLERGAEIVFATTDREIVGEAHGNWVKIVSRAAKVARSGTGEPIHVESIIY